MAGRTTRVRNARFGNQGPHTFDTNGGNSGYDNRNNGSWQSSQHGPQGFNGQGFGQHGNWQSSQNEPNRGPHPAYRHGFERGFDAGFSAGYQAGFTHATDSNVASTNQSGQSTQDGMTSSGANASGATSQTGSSGTSGSQLSASQVRTQLQQSGYSNVRDMHHAGNTFTAKADKNGQAMNVTVDAKTGNVTSSTKG